MLSPVIHPIRMQINSTSIRDAVMEKWWLFVKHAQETNLHSPCTVCERSDFVITVHATSNTWDCLWFDCFCMTRVFGCDCSEGSLTWQSGPSVSEEGHKIHKPRRKDTRSRWVHAEERNKQAQYKCLIHKSQLENLFSLREYAVTSPGGTCLLLTAIWKAFILEEQSRVGIEGFWSFCDRAWSHSILLLSVAPLVCRLDPKLRQILTLTKAPCHYWRGEHELLAPARCQPASSPTWEIAWECEIKRLRDCCLGLWDLGHLCAESEPSGILLWRETTGNVGLEEIFLVTASNEASQCRNHTNFTEFCSVWPSIQWLLLTAGYHRKLFSRLRFAWLSCINWNINIQIQSGNFAYWLDCEMSRIQSKHVIQTILIHFLIPEPLLRPR